MDQELLVRLALKYDSYLNWTNTSEENKGANHVLLKGEIGLCEISSKNTDSTVDQTVLFKVGDGTKKFSELPWASALASDVHDWAKATDVSFDETTKTITFIGGNSDGTDKVLKLKYTTPEEVQALISPIAADIAAIQAELSNEGTTGSAIASFSTRLNTIEGNAAVSGSIKKAAADTLIAAEAYSNDLKAEVDNKIDSEVSAVYDKIDIETVTVKADIATINANLSTEGTTGKAIKDAQSRLARIEGTGTGSIQKAKEEAVSAAQSISDAAKIELAGEINTVNNKILTESDTRNAAIADIMNNLSSTGATGKAISGVQNRLNILEGTDTTAGSIKKAAKDTLDSAKALIDEAKTDTNNTFNNAITTIDTKINNEASVRAADIAAINTKLGSDGTVGKPLKAATDRIAVIEGSATTTGSIKKAQADAISAAQTKVNEAKTELRTEISTVDGRIDTEVETINADIAEINTNLSSKGDTGKAIASVKSRLDIIEGADTVAGSIKKAAKDTLASAETLVNNAKTALNTTITTVDNKITSEASTRNAAIAKLTTDKADASTVTSHTGNKSNPHGVSLSQLGVNASATELNYTKGVTSAIQTQLNNKASSTHSHGLLNTSLLTTLANTNTDSGWSMINSNYNGGILAAIRTQGSAPVWIHNNYAPGIAFGGADTKGVMSMAYNTPSVRFAAGNGTKPVWHYTLTGTNGSTYNLNNFSPSGHTHSYAGSGSAGGAATSANKLNTNAGDADTPVYFSNGVPVACTSLDLNAASSTYGKRLYAPSIASTAGTTYTIDTYLTLIKGTLPLDTQGYYTWKHSWSYSGNGLLSATIGSSTHKIQLAGAHCEFIGGASGEYVLRITTATTSGTTGASFTTGATYQYNCHGSGYSPTWTIDSSIVGLSVSGKTITYTKNNGTTGTITTQDTNTTYSAATTSAAGLMSAADKTKLNGIATGANAYAHPTTPGNKHIPSGGSAGQILRWSADGTAAWGADNNTTYTLGSFGVTATAAELNYCDGVTSNIQKQLNNLASDIDLNAMNIEGAYDNVVSLYKAYTGALNNLTAPGFYYVSNADATNYPVGTNGHVLVMANTGSAEHIRQVFWRAGTINSNSYQWYTRSKTANGWSAWWLLSGIETRYTGTLTSGTANVGSIYGGASGWVIVAQVGANKRRSTLFIPRTFLNTDANKWCFTMSGDDYYFTFYFYYSGTTLYLKTNTSNPTTNAITHVYAIS
jgi:uncharacterized protein (UPF0335 family)